jgi:predicted DNA-binding transcriptional regulator AlpA
MAKQPKTRSIADAAKHSVVEFRSSPPPPRAKMQKIGNSSDDGGDGEPAPRYGNEPIRFLSKADVVTLCHVSFPTIWKWMQQGVFPKGREVGGKTCWRSDEIADWQNNRPFAQVKSGE